MGVGPTLTNWTLLIPFFGLLAVAVVWDLHQRRIPNAIPLALVTFGLGANFWLQPVGPALLLTAGGLLAGFSFWLAPYLLRMVGAADLKLAAAVGAWLGPLGVVRVSVYAALAGGVLALITLMRSQGVFGSLVWLRTVPIARGTPLRGSAMTTLPYALAIAVGVVCELLGGRLLGGLPS
jgi:prepilin peptidase CpaA